MALSAAYFRSTWDLKLYTLNIEFYWQGEGGSPKEQTPESDQRFIVIDSQLKPVWLINRGLTRE